MKHKIWLTALIISITSFTAFAVDSFEDYLKQQMNDYNTYLEKIDREFTSFLKQKWEPYDAKKPKKLLDEPKPVDIPVAKPEKKPEPIVLKPKPEPKEEPVAEKEPVKMPAPVPVPEVKPEPQPDITKEPVPAPPVVKEPVPVEPAPQEPVVKEPEPTFKPSGSAKGLALSFYGVELDVPFDKKLKTPVAKPLSSKTIAKWWEDVASSDYKKTLIYMKKTAADMNLGDWGYVNLIERFSAKLLGDVPERKMLVWFYMNKGGYNAKLGYTDDGRTKVMSPTDKELYGVPYYTFSGERYYVIDIFGKKEETEPLYTYQGSYPDAKDIIKLSHMAYPKLGFAGFARELTFDIEGTKHKINAIANRYSIAYLNNFPQADLPVYTGAKTPEWIDQTILPEIKKLTLGKNAKEAVDIILRFVQTAFEYKTDDQQFGREKFFFAEETIYYPYSDCEDRSVLFAFLVRKVLGLDVVMLDFPGHIATAVNLGKYNTGAVLMYNGEKYTVADPTYINATAGMVMPQFKNSSPEIIETEL
jgi:hypothetical protein